MVESKVCDSRPLLRQRTTPAVRSGQPQPGSAVEVTSVGISGVGRDGSGESMGVGGIQSKLWESKRGHPGISL